MAERWSTRKRLERLLGPARDAAEKAETPPPAGAGKGLTSLDRLEREILGEHATEPLSVKERLARLIAAKSARPVRPPSFVPISERLGPFATLEELVDGSERENARGRFYQIDTAYARDHRHGEISLSRLEAIPSSSFSILAAGGEQQPLDLARCVFLDTETTGLAGGAGTCAFLVGVGYIDDDTFRVHQLFMRDYSEEEAMLYELSGILSRFEGLVSFNGKAFDVPLLESRYILSRLRFPLAEAPHFDLLYPARILWKPRLESCRLAELEVVLLGHEREGDVPSALIPRLYFDYVRTKDASGIYRVFRHNCDDILSLAALTIRAADMLDEDAAPQHALDDYSLGRIFDRAALTQRSIEHYRRAVDGGIQGSARRRALRRLADQHKKRDEVAQAMALWRELCSEEGPEAIDALEQMSMVLEHRDGDFRAALECCEQALLRLEVDSRLPYGFRDRRRGDLEHRRQRLKRRLGRKRWANRVEE